MATIEDIAHFLADDSDLHTSEVMKELKQEGVDVERYLAKMHEIRRHPDIPIDEAMKELEQQGLERLRERAGRGEV